MPTILRSLGLAAVLVGLLAPAASAQDTWRLRLENVTVDRARESGGDRPYVVMIAFQSRLFTRRSTRVELYEREPHDWVSKPEYRGTTRLRQGDHMSSRESLPLPEWMGLHVYDPIAMTSLAPPQRTALRAPIFGAFIVVLDNNNTPPGAIRTVATTLRDWTEAYLREQVEQGGMAREFADGTVTQQELEASLRTFGARAMQQLDIGRVLETAFALTVGPLGNPDKLVGIHALVFPAVEGLATSEQTGRFSVPILGENVEWSTVVGSPGAGFTRNLVFEGSGARYRILARLAPGGLTSATRVRQLTLRLRTGDDDLREGSRVRATALDARGRVLGQGDLNGGERWEDRSTKTVVLRLSNVVPVTDIARIRLEFTSGGGMSGDNWNLDMLTVYTDPATAPLASQQGRPLKRFTGDDRTFEIALH